MQVCVSFQCEQTIAIVYFSIRQTDTGGALTALTVTVFYKCIVSILYSICCIHLVIS